MYRTAVACLACLVAQTWTFATTASAADEKKPAEPVKKVTFEDDVLPIFRAKCGTCHNGSDRRGGLVLDDYATMMEGGASGDVVFGGDLESSYLWLLITHDSEPVMPPNAPKLPDEELAVVRQWIEQGILRDKGSKAKKSAPNPALAKVTATMERPDGPPPMPTRYLGDPALTPPRPNSVTGLAVNPWSSLAAIAGHEQVTLVDLNLMVPVGTLPYPEGTPQQIGFSQNGQILFVGGGRGGQSGNVVLFDVASGERIATVGQEYDAATAADLSPDLSLVVIGTPKKVVRVYETASGEKVYEQTKHTDWVTATSFSPDGVLLATADRSGGLVVWEAETGREFHILAGHKGPINAIGWRADSNLFATAGQDGQVHLWEMNEGKEVKKFNANVGEVSDLEYTRDGNLLVTGRSDVARLFDAAGKQLAEFKGLSDDGMRVAFDHEGGRALAGDWTGKVVVWKADGKSVVGELKTNEPGAQAQLSWVGGWLNKQTAERKKVTDQLNALNADLAKRAKSAADAKAGLDQAKAAFANVQKQVAERDSVVTAGQKAVATQQATHKKATEAVAAAKKRVDQIAAVVTQSTKTRDEAKKAVETAAESPELKAAAEKALAAASDALNKTVAEQKKRAAALDQANKAVAAAKAALDTANAELAKRVAARKQLDEKQQAAQKQLAAWEQTFAKASPVGNPTDAEKKQQQALQAKLQEIDAKVKPLVDRKQRLQQVLALGATAEK